MSSQKWNVGGRWLNHGEMIAYREKKRRQAAGEPEAVTPKVKVSKVKTPKVLKPADATEVVAEEGVEITTPDVSESTDLKNEEALRAEYDSIKAKRSYTKPAIAARYKELKKLLGIQ